MIFPVSTSAIVQHVARWFLIQFDWLTLLVPTAAVVFCIAIVILPVGRRRIGGADARPEFNLPTWFSMLFAAGMGAGLVFWGAAEPLIHMIAPPPDGAAPESPEARHQALAITQFHWSIHAWAIYAVGALVIAMTSAPGQAPLPSRPLAGLPRVLRRIIDWTALVAVVFGLVASVGQGVLQLGAGVTRLSDGGIANGLSLQVTLLVVLTVCYLVSASTGLRRGIAWLSNINMGLAAVLALFVFAVADTGAILSTMVASIRAYTAEFIPLSVGLREEGLARQWTRDWSLTYFLWWVAWAPFVGVFIARISRGRTLRVFILGVVLVPSLVTLLWFSIFGGAALSLHNTGVDLGVRDFDTAPAAAYVVLSYLPFASLAQAATFVLVFIFILTSADSGSYVLSIFSRGRTGDPPVAERLFWGGVLSALTAAAILSAEGQAATRSLAVAGAVPLTLLLIVQGAVFSFRTNWLRVGIHPRIRKATDPSSDKR